MKHWSSENDSFLYKKRLQEKFTAKDSWLLWSTERMDPEILKDEIDQLTMQIVKKKFQLSFNFGMVRKDTKFSNNSRPSKWNKAMIMEATKREEKNEAYSVLGRIFSTSNNIKVLGTEMRMIPVLNSDLPSHTKRKIARMTHKQEQFLSTLMTKPCVYLSDIDYYNSTLKEIQSNIPITIKYQHAKGHQDRKRKPLTLLETLNYIMDKRTGQYCEYIEMSSQYEYSNIGPQIKSTEVK